MFDRRTVTAGLLTGLATAGHAWALDDLGPPIGTKAPTIGHPPDQTNTPRDIKELSGPKGLVLVFFRSAGWCPFCQAQLISMNGVAAEIQAKGYRLAGLSYDEPKVLADFTARRSIAYPLLSDPKSEVIRRYNLIDPQYPPGNKAYGVPRPIIFVIDRKGVIRAKLYEEAYRTRPPAELVVKTLDNLPKA